MKMEMNYVAPEVEMVEVEVELGYDASTEGPTVTPPAIDEF